MAARAAASSAAASVPRICVLGGGVAGLSAAYFLQRGLPHARICVVETSKRCGGQVKSSRSSTGGVLEQGFHSSILVDRHGREALGLLRLLGLDEDVVSANVESSSRRHLLHNGRVQLVPGLAHMLRYGPAFLLEPLWPRGRNSDDESVHSFVSRRVSAGVADSLADPICRGQLAGDARELSARTCFPRLWYNERRFRSVFLGSALSVIPAHRRRSWLSLDLTDPLLQRVVTGGRCYSLRQGLGALPARLEELLRGPPAGTRPAEVLTEASVAALRPTAAAEAASAGEPAPSVEVVLTSGRQIAADVVVSARSPRDLSDLLRTSGLDSDAEGNSLCADLDRVKFAPVSVVNVSFARDVLRGRFRGTGYFCGSLEGSPVLAVTSDSQLFPVQDSPQGATRLSVHVDGRTHGTVELAEAAALEALRAHLGVTEEPAEVSTTLWAEAAPQYGVGHRSLLRRIEAQRRRRLPWLQLAGPGYFGTRSVADEVVDARELADSLCRRFAGFPGLVENEVDEDTAGRYGGGFDVE